jgi:hypothetical protein
MRHSYEDIAIQGAVARAVAKAFGIEEVPTYQPAQKFWNGWAWGRYVGTSGNFVVESNPHVLTPGRLTDITRPSLAKLPDDDDDDDDDQEDEEKEEQDLIRPFDRDPAMRPFDPDVERRIREVLNSTRPGRDPNNLTGHSRETFGNRNSGRFQPGPLIPHRSEMPDRYARANLRQQRQQRNVNELLADDSPLIRAFVNGVTVENWNERQRELANYLTRLFAYMAAHPEQGPYPHIDQVFRPVWLPDLVHPVHGRIFADDRPGAFRGIGNRNFWTAWDDTLTQLYNQTHADRMTAAAAGAALRQMAQYRLSHLPSR